MSKKSIPAPGDIDPDFPPVSVPAPADDPHIILTLASGEIIVGCLPCAIARLTADRQVDETFGENGYVVISLNELPCSLESVHLLPDGGYILRIETITEIDNITLSCLALVRLTSNGQRNQQFGPDGVRLYPLRGGKPLPPQMRELPGQTRSTDNARGPNRFPERLSGDLSVQADGALFVLMSVKTIDSGTYRSYVLKLLDNGDPDPGFNGNGVMEPTGSAPFVGHAMVVQKDRAFVISGVYPPPDPSTRGVGFIARFNNDGTLDKDFATDGEFIDFGPYDYTQWYFLLPHDDGAISCVGHNGAYTITGQGLTKVCTIDANGQNPSARIALLKPDTDDVATLRAFTAILDRAGRVVLGGRLLGQSGPALISRAFLGRVNGNGSVDPDLGYKGVRIYEDMQSLDALNEDSISDGYLVAVYEDFSANKIYRFFSTP